LYVKRPLLVYDDDEDDDDNSVAVTGWTRLGDVVFFGKSTCERIWFDSYGDREIQALDQETKLLRKSPEDLPWCELEYPPEHGKQPETTPQLWWMASKETWSGWAQQEQKWLRKLLGPGRLPNWCMPLAVPCSGLLPEDAMSRTFSPEDFEVGTSITYWLAKTSHRPAFSRAWLQARLMEAIYLSPLTVSEFIAKRNTLEAAQIVADALSAIGLSRPRVEDATWTFTASAADASEFQPSEYVGDVPGIPSTSRQNARWAYLAAMSLLETWQPARCVDVVEAARQTLCKMGVPMVVQAEDSKGESRFFAWTIPEAWFRAALNMPRTSQESFGVCCVLPSQAPAEYVTCAPFAEPSDTFVPKTAVRLRGRTLADVKAYRGFTDAAHRIFGLDERPLQVVFLDLSGNPGVSVYQACGQQGTSEEKTLDMCLLEEPRASRRECVLEEEMDNSFERPPTTLSPKPTIRSLSPIAKTTAAVWAIKRGVPSEKKRNFGEGRVFKL
jgi:hypothetical protein